MLIDVLVMVASIMTIMLQMMLANVDEMVLDVMTTPGVCAIWEIVVSAITTDQHVFQVNFSDVEEYLILYIYIYMVYMWLS